MTDEQKAALRALAEAATPGPWNAETLPFDYGMPPHDADYIAAAHPAAVLALLDEVERLREALRFYSGHAAIPNDGPWGVDSRDFGKVARAALEPRDE